MAGDKINQEQKTGASYVFTFYESIQRLNHNHALYVNLQAEISAHYGKDATQYTEEQKAIVNQTVQNVRYEAQTCYTCYKTLQETLEPLEDKDKKLLEGVFKKIRGDYIMNLEQLDEYVELMNKFLMKSIIKDILNSSKEIMQGAFG